MGGGGVGVGAGGERKVGSSIHLNRKELSCTH